MDAVLRGRMGTVRDGRGHVGYLLLIGLLVTAGWIASSTTALAANHNVAMTCTAYDGTTGFVGTAQAGDTITITSWGTCSRTNPMFWDSTWFTWSGPTTGGSSISSVSTPVVLTITGTTPGVIETRFDDGNAGHAFVLSANIPTLGPNGPTNFAATARNQAIQLNFTPGGLNGGTFSRWEYSTDNGATWAYLEKPDGSGVYTAPPVLIKYVSSGGQASNQLTRARLANGTAYTVKMRGFNVSSSAGPEVSAGVITPTQTAPGAPTALVPTAVSRGISLAFKEPTYDGGISVDDGGSTITGYEYSINSGFSWTATPSLTWQSDPANSGAGRPQMTSFTVPGLTNGTAYAVQLRAVNAIGNGMAATAASATPQATPPDAPTGLSVTNGSGQATISFTAGSDYGVAITNYEYQLSNSGTWVAFSPAVTSGPVTITGLTNGTTYPVKLRAVSADGAGTASNSATLQPYGTPGNPSGLTATAGDQSIGLSFTDAALNGNNFYEYQYTTDGGTSWATASCPMPPMNMPMPCSQSVSNPATLTITKQSAAPNNTLVNGATYQVAVRIKCGISWPGSTTSATSTVAVTPAAAPSTPTSLSVTNGNGQATVTFTAGADGGSAITNYEYSTDGGTNWVTPSPAVTSSPITITGLSNGTTYTVKLRAVNAVGTSAASSSVTAAPQAVAPSAPTALAATRGDASISIAFTAGANGGAAISNYEYELNGSGTWVAFSPAQTSSPVTISSLTNGTAYTVKLRAVNTAGSGAASSATSSVTPVALAAAPTSLNATAGNGSITVSFTAGSNGGSTITNYEYQLDGGGPWLPFTPPQTSSPVTISGLTNGVAHTVKLRAFNSAGPGVASTATSSVTPMTAASAPTGLTATPHDQSIDVAFTPGADGGSAISNYEYRLNGTGSWTVLSPSDTTSPITITGLTNGTAYSVELRAVTGYSSAGTASGATASVTPAAVPLAPTITSATAGNGSASIAFTAGTTGGSAITNYEYSTDNGSTWVTPSPAVTTSPLAITGLTGGTSYQVKLRAVNAIGSGAASSASLVTPTVGVPAAPATLSLTAGVTSVTIAFTPGATGGAAITDYEYSTDGGTTWISAATTSSPITVSGLTGGTAYTIGLRAVNSAGAGAVQSGSVTPLSASVPSAPSSGGSGATPTTGGGGGGASSQPSRGGGSTSGAGANGGNGGGGANGGGSSTGGRGTTAGALVVSTAPPVPWPSAPTQAQVAAAFSGPLAPTGAAQLLPGTGTRAMALIGGTPSPVEVHVDTEANELVLRGRSFRNDISAVDENGRRLPLSQTGQLTLEPGIGVHVSGFGYQPNSDVNVFRHSEPALLGIVHTDAQGRYDAVLQLPRNTQPGDHTIESVGTDADGSVRALALGVKVKPAAKTRVLSTTLFFTPNANRPGITAQAQLDALLARIPVTATKVNVTVRARAYRISTQRNAMLFAKQRALITTALIKAHGLRGTYRSEWSAPSPTETRFLRIASIEIAYVVRS